MDMQQPTKSDPPPLAITLAPQQWHVVMTALNEAPLPHRVMRPVIDAVARQLYQQQSQQAWREAAKEADRFSGSVAGGGDG
jgi:hypothetical protein